MGKLKDLKLSDILPLIRESAVRYKKQIFLAIILLVVMSGVGIVVSIEVFKYLYERLPRELLNFSLDKEVRASAETWIPVKANIDQVVHVHLQKTLNTNVPFKDTLSFTVDEDFTVPVDLELKVPVDQDIFVDDVIALSTTLTIDAAEVKTQIWGLGEVSLPVKGTFPVNIEVPFKRAIHVKDVVDFKLKKEFTFHIKKKLDVPLDLKVKASLPIDEVFSVPIKAIIDANAMLVGEVPFTVHFDFALDKDGTLTVK
ncbi:MAG: hypothetical protein JSU92_13950 [Deltaproteobacteria bacterium]|nr:MAG: hypothetical protein JSU92_13950 [Deltaproteobacteria bacterium]